MTVNIDLSKTGVRIDKVLAPEFKDDSLCTIVYPYDSIKLTLDKRDVDAKL